MSTIPTSTQLCNKGRTRNIRQGSETEDIYVGKEKKKKQLFVNDIPLYKENS